MVHDGVSASRVVESFRPHVALLDIGMPGLDGYQLAKAIRAKPYACEVRLIALTGWGLDSDRAEALEAGFHYHLTKPPDLDELERLVESIGAELCPAAGCAASRP
jgi:CheY-like chemotaxis protein